jgi:hypothetical protein
MKKTKYLLLFIFIELSVSCLAQNPFTPGNIVVYRVGDGSAVLSRAYAKVYLDEYTPNGTLVQSILMPTDNNASGSRLTARGNNSDMGYLNLTTDGHKLVVPGINSALTDDPLTTNPTASVIGLVDFNGSINTSTAVTNNTEGFFTLSAISNNGNNIWFRVPGALRYTTTGSNTSVKLNTSSSQAASGDLKIADGQLYANTYAVPLIRTVGTGLPVTNGQSFTGLAGIPDDIQGTGQFAFADLNPSVPGADVLYVASTEEFADPAVGIRKFSLVGGIWVDNGSVGGDVDNSWYQGLTLKVSGSTVTLFATRKGNNNTSVRGGELVKIIDNTGYNATFIATPVVIASVSIPNTMAFRGVALVPQPATFTPGNIVVYRVGDGSVALTKSYARVYLDEYTPNGILVQSLLMPAENNGSNSRLTVRGNNTDMGYLNLSADEKKLIIPGINSALTDAVTVNPTASVIGLVDFNATINTTTKVTDNTEGFFTNSAVSTDGNNIWFKVPGAIRYTTAGSSTSVKLNTSSSQASANDLKIADGQLYTNTFAVPFIRTVGTGTPVTAGQIFTGLPGIADDIQGPGAFAFADIEPSVPGVDVLYVASPEEFADPAVGIRKFSLVGGLWVDNGSVGGDVDNSWYKGLTLKVSGTSVAIYTTRKGNNSFSVLGGELVKLIDNSGYNGTINGIPVVIASVAVPNTMAFRGVAKVPSGCPAVINLRVPDISATQANILWNAPPAGSGVYEYAVTTSTTPPSSGATTSNASFNITGLTNSTTYYVHVRTSCSAISKSEWETVSFTTGCKPPAVPLISISISSAGLVQAKWNKVFGAAGYEYFISTSAAPPSSGVVTADTSFTISNLNSVVQYYLHVRSNCGSGSFSGWTVKAFTTGCFMPSPGVTVLTKTARVKWNSIANAVRYEYTLAYTPAKPFSGHSTTDTIYSVGRVDEGTAYYFHIRSVCSTGVVSEWNTISFNVQGLQVYPNPIKEVLNIQLNGLNSPSSEIIIADVMGRIISRLRLNNNTATVNTADWAPGIYLVRYDDGKNTYSVKIVKDWH